MFSIFTFFNALQFVKHPFPSQYTLFGITTVSRCVQLLKVFLVSPCIVELPIVTVYNEVHPENMSTPWSDAFVVQLGISIVVKCVHP